MRKQSPGYLLISLILLLLTFSAVAHNKYQVELIIFTHINATAVRAENWPDVSPQFPDGMQQLSSFGDDIRAPFQLLPQRFFNMMDIQQVINAHPGYQVIMHIAWRQDITDSLEMPTHIFGGTAYTMDGKTLDTKPEDMAAMASNKVWQANGYIQLNKDRYFNVKLNFYFAMPKSQFDMLSGEHVVNDEGLQYFQLDQSRRMKSNEINYIDFPLYGIVMLIKPVV